MAIEFRLRWYLRSVKCDEHIYCCLPRLGMWLHEATQNNNNNNNNMRNN